MFVPKWGNWKTKKWELILVSWLFFKVNYRWIILFFRVNFHWNIAVWLQNSFGVTTLCFFSNIVPLAAKSFLNIFKS